MSAERFFLDTAFAQALLNRRDQDHLRARTSLSRVRDAAEVWITEAVLVEVAKALSGIDRAAASRFISQCYRTANTRVVQVDTPLLLRGLELYQSRPDKSWGLTDGISFVVMADHGLTEAVTSGAHLQQAGYRALMIEP